MANPLRLSQQRPCIALMLEYKAIPLIHGFPKPNLKPSQFPLLQTCLITSMTGLKYWLEIYTELVNLNYIATNDL